MRWILALLITGCTVNINLSNIHADEGNIDDRLIEATTDSVDVEKPSL